MAKQILIGITERELSEIAHYISHITRKCAAIRMHGWGNFMRTNIR